MQHVLILAGVLVLAGVGFILGAEAGDPVTMIGAAIVAGIAAVAALWYFVLEDLFEVRRRRRILEAARPLCSTDDLVGLASGDLDDVDQVRELLDHLEECATCSSHFDVLVALRVWRRVAISGIAAARVQERRGESPQGLM